MEYAKKTVMNPFLKSQPDKAKAKTSKDDNFMRLLLHVARNDGYNENGLFKYRGRAVPDSDISALINFAVMPLKVPKGLDYFLNFLQETEVDQTLISNQNFLEKLSRGDKIDTLHELPSRTIITPVPKKTYHYEPVIREESETHVLEDNAPEVVSHGINQPIGDPEEHLEPPGRNLSPIQTIRRGNQKNRKITKHLQKSSASAAGTSVRKGSREKKQPQRYGAGWFIPE